MKFNVDSFNRVQKRAIMVSLDALVIAVAFWLSLTLRIGVLWPQTALHDSWPLVAILTVAGIVLFYLLGVYQNMLRSIDIPGYLAIATGTFLLTILFEALLLFQAISTVPATSPIIFFFSATVGLISYRVLGRSFFYWMKFHRINKTPVVIYGAGDTGTRLAIALKQDSDYNPVAFIDDDPQLHLTTIHGCPVLTPSELPRLISKHSVKKIFLALPSITARRKKDIMKGLSTLGIEIQSVPSLSELVGGFAKVDHLSHIDSNRLLNRPPIKPILKLSALSVRNKSVLVTGGGGSIGSELCRQILDIGPRCLVILDSCELALYNIVRELNEILESTEKDIPLYAVLGSVTDELFLRDAVQRYSVQTLYHAAAYKHVPVLEGNIISGIRNNVIGTKIVAETAADCGIERAILISTDKAVRPTNVMGASKRLAELVFQDVQSRVEDTIFSIVRFGNVINSSGSVVPLFQKQIRNFGPVTVTHPEVTRYFMTIPEAAQLVIQAGSMASGGDVFILDMGEPIKIVELARRMIELSGLKVRDEDNPFGNIPIVFTGLRPGEKLHEELLIDDNILPSAHPKIMRAKEKRLSSTVLAEILVHLLDAVTNNDEIAAIQCLQRAVPEYEANPSILESVTSSCSGAEIRQFNVPLPLPIGNAVRPAW